MEMDAEISLGYLKGWWACIGYLRYTRIQWGLGFLALGLSFGFRVWFNSGLSQANRVSQ